MFNAESWILSFWESVARYFGFDIGVRIKDLAGTVGGIFIGAFLTTIFFITTFLDVHPSDKLIGTEVVAMRVEKKTGKRSEVIIRPWKDFHKNAVIQAIETVISVVAIKLFRNKTVTLSNLPRYRVVFWILVALLVILTYFFLRSGSVWLKPEDLG